MSPAPRTVPYFKLAALVVVLGALSIAHRTGVLARFGDPERVRETFVGFGVWGQVAFVGAYTVLQPFGVPGTVFVLAAPLVWPWPVAFALSMLGTMAATVVGFSFARFVGRDFVAGKLPAGLRRYEDALSRRAFATVFLMRFVFWMPQWLHVFFGVSKVPFWTHFWGSFTGYVLPLLLVSYFGERLFKAIRSAPPEAWVAAGVTTVAVAAGVWWFARRRPRNDSPV